MKESKRILSNLLKIKEEVKPKRVQINMKRKYRLGILSKYGSVEEFEKVVDELHKEVLKQGRD